ncbi:restriction endonuclease subunit S [Prosthecochloris sp. CIB 2401]|uniref:restriction endonuclease subunit S n=1 Tax=Prosthecochloris sp. CIB 2401 TaxID=1868325 RepID=UPI00080AA2C7|nr:restriction endonuclease subunit S [Prosthecochloris sp. CIB 2401]ANT63919.1 EcoKI restriction-modification system protein HsdS [Prosthecochloris sp. CIB 2401]
MKLLKNTEHVRLGSVCSKIGSGATPRGGDGVYIDAGTAIIRSQNVYNGIFETAGLAYLTEQHAEQLKGVTVESRDVLLNITGDSVARCCQVPDSVLPARVNQHVSIIRPNEEKLLPEFLCYYLVSPLMQKYLLSRAGSGGTRKALTKGMIKDFEVPKPSIIIQQKIVDTLSAYDNLIENNRRRIQLLEQSARLLYKEWFVNLRFPGHEHTNIIDGVPEGWERKPLCEIGDITMGQSPNSIYYNVDANGLPFHQGVSNFGVRFPSHETYCTVQGRIAEPGDILFSVRAPVGRINITPDKIVIGRGLAAIRSSCSQQNFLFYALKSFFFKEDMMGGGAIFAAITKKDLYGVELVQPTDKIVAMFMAHVLPIDIQIANLQQTIENLAKARDLLLPKLMNGEIAV